MPNSYNLNFAEGSFLLRFAGTVPRLKMSLKRKFHLNI